MNSNLKVHISLLISAKLGVVDLIQKDLFFFLANQQRTKTILLLKFEPAMKTLYHSLADWKIRLRMPQISLQIRANHAPKIVFSIHESFRTLGYILVSQSMCQQICNNPTLGQNQLRDRGWKRLRDSPPKIHLRSAFKQLSERLSYITQINQDLSQSSGFQ